MGRKSKGYELVQYDWSPKWYLSWCEGHRSRRQSTGTESRQEAEKYRSAFVYELGKEQRDAQDHLIIDEIVDDYMEEHSTGTASHQVNQYFSAVIKDFFGKTLGIALEPYQVRDFTTQQTEAGKKLGTIRRQLTLLLAALNHARKKKRLSLVPPVALPALTPPKDVWLNKKQAQKLLNAAGTAHLKLFIAMALFTGQRKGAILDLKWPQVDMESRLINFNPPGRAQTNKRRSSVPINDELLSMLKLAQRDAQKKYKKRGYRSEHVIDYKKRGNADGRLGDIKKGFKKACDDAALEKVTPHTLRHTAGTWLAQAGVDMWRISGILGHSHSKTTELYAKHHPEYFRDAVSNLQLARKLRVKGTKKPKKQSKPHKFGTR